MATKKILHKRSNVINTDGSPKLPTSEQIEVGELAINYADGVEVISIKNSAGNIIPFIPKRAFIEAKILTENPGYLLGVTGSEIVRVEMPYLTVPEGDIVIDYLGNAVEVNVSSNTSWDISQ